jgi:hypothetical protein
MKKLFSFSVFFSLLFLFYSLASAEVPQMINYQGKLTTSAGAPVNDTLPMVFSIYSDTGGTNLLWTETQSAVVVEKGVFNVLLGSVDSIPYSVFDGSIRYLGVKVGGEEITPRKAMVSVAYAFHALTADSALNVAEAGLVSVDGVSNPGGNVDLIQQNAITIIPDDGADTITIGETHSARTDNPHLTTAAQTGALVSVDGVSNAGGNVDFVVGSNMTITPDDGANTITFSASGADNDWTFRVTDTADTTLITGGAWGIARYGNTLYGNADSTHVNLGVASTTGSYGLENYKYCTVSGGVNNRATHQWTTVGGGEGNQATGKYGTVAGGQGNVASGGYHATVGGGVGNTAGWAATVGGGGYNAANGLSSTVGGGLYDTANGEYATVPGGYKNTAGGDYSFAVGREVKVTSTATYTFAFGNNFTTSASHAVIFHDTETPIKVGIGTTNPQRALHISDVMRLEPRASAPASPSEGDIYVNSTDHHIYCYLNGVWKQLDN